MTAGSPIGVTWASTRPRSRNDGVPVDTVLAMLLLVPFAVAGVVDLPRAIRLGPITMLGLLSSLQFAAAATGLLLARSYPRVVISRFLPYALFLFWMIARSLIEPLERAGIQTGVSYMLFGTQFLLAGTMAARRPATMRALLRWGFLALDAIGLTLIVINVLRFGLGGDWLVGSRSVALLAIIPISWHLAGWAYGRRGAGVRALAWIAVVLVSLSRTAAVMALLSAAITILASGCVRPGRLVRRTPALAAGTAILAGVVVAYASEFHERFFGGYDQLDVAGVSFSPSGRNHIWPIVIESAMQHPIVGGGLGSSQAALLDFDSETVGHPHNEYLRVWHDGGIVGVLLLVFAFVRWLIVLGRQWLRTARRPWLYPDLQLAAFLTLLGVVLSAITDNGLVYTFVTAPSGLLVGAAMGVYAGPAHTEDA